MLDALELIPGADDVPDVQTEFDIGRIGRDLGWRSRLPLAAGPKPIGTPDSCRAVSLNATETGIDVTQSYATPCLRRDRRSMSVRAPSFKPYDKETARLKSLPIDDALNPVRRRRVEITRSEIAGQPECLVKTLATQADRSWRSSKCFAEPAEADLSHRLRRLAGGDDRGASAAGKDVRRFYASRFRRWTRLTVSIALSMLKRWLSGSAPQAIRRAPSKPADHDKSAGRPHADDSSNTEGSTLMRRPITACSSMPRRKDGRPRRRHRSAWSADRGGARLRRAARSRQGGDNGA